MKTRGARGVTAPETAARKPRRPALPQRVVAYVWARAAGRCEFLGCNDALWKDVLTNKEANVAKLAHIIAASPDGPRGDPILSPKLATEASNIMLLCGTHHDLVDDKKLETSYTVEVLRSYKERHEARVERLTAIDESRRSVVLTVHIPVGEQMLDSDPVEIDLAMAAEDLYPDDRRKVHVNLNGMLGRDRDDAFWKDARAALRDRLAQQLRGAEHHGPLSHISVFAFGPIPLLIELGYLLDEKGNCTIFNRHRKPKGWRWPRGKRRSSEFQVVGAQEARAAEVALVLSVTSRVQRPAMHAVVSPDMPVVELACADPLLDGVRSPEELVGFASAARRAMEEIHRMGARRVHLFPATPVCAAVEFGRIMQKKLHPPIVVYDHHSGAGGWRAAFCLDARPEASRAAWASH